MNYRMLGKTGFKISEISLGTWQVGGRWGEDFNDSNADAVLKSALDAGVNFIDTADAYGGGLSEKAVGRAVKTRADRIYVATKCGRRISPHVNEGYTVKALRGFVEDSLANMGMDCLDLVQLHCPPAPVYYRPEIFGLFDDLKREGKILNLGVSVEKVEEAIKATEYPNVATVQIIFNMFRHRPSELFFALAKKRGTGIIIRVPLASGLLSGKLDKASVFAAGDHRAFNRNGEAFDKGETFSGIDYETGLAAVEELKTVFADAAPLPQFALRWILMFDAVSCVIPGASRPDQVEQNAKAADLPPLTRGQMRAVKAVYDKYVRGQVHQRW